MKLTLALVALALLLTIVSSAPAPQDGGEEGATEDGGSGINANQNQGAQISGGGRDISVSQGQNANIKGKGKK